MALTKVSYSMITGAPANVDDYGADPTGVADCTAAFQAAIDTGRAVYVPTGTYLIRSSLQIPPQFTMYGDGSNKSGISFKPLTNDVLLDGPVSSGRFILRDIFFIGTDSFFDPNKTPLIKSAFFITVEPVRLNWDSISVLGFNADNVISVNRSIETYIYRSFFFGPYFSLTPDPVGPTTTRTSNCFLFAQPWNTTTHIVDCFIQHFKFGIQIENGFSNRIERCTLESNFISIVCYKNGGSGSGIQNNVKDCYFEANTYSLGGAGLASDFSDIANPAKFALLFFEDCYFHDSAQTGGNSISDSPNYTYGTVRNQFTIAMRGLHSTFLSSQTGWSHVAGQFDSYLDQVPNYGDTNIQGTTGVQIGFRRNINNDGFDKQFRLLAKTGSSVGTDCSIGFIADQARNSLAPISDGWTPAEEYWRFRIQGANSYLSGGGAYNTSGADYAEMFEWLDGNSDAEDRVGRLVYLDGDKVTLDANGEPIGVVSATASVIGNNWSEQWSNRLLRDDFGREVIDENGSRVTNPEFDPKQQYKPRNERKEWAVIGLVGRLRVRNDELVPASWIKLRDISNNVAEYLVK